MKYSGSFKNLIFEGGGVKAIAYVGALHILEREEILTNIENVAGTSGGAIVAALVALNYTSDEIHNIISNMNLKKFEDRLWPFRLFASYGLFKGDAFLKWMRNKIKRKGLNPSITFGELESKGNYKNLKIFATDLYTKSIREFSSNVTPKTIVAEAVRASMSIPLFFKSWQFTNKEPNNHIYVDGSVLYNSPIQIFKDLDQTLGFYLANLTNVKPHDEFGNYHLGKYAGNLFDTLLKSQSITFEQNRREKLQSVIINDLNVSAADFGLTLDMKNKLVRQGEIATKKYFNPKVDMLS